MRMYFGHICSMPFCRPPSLAFMSRRTKHLSTVSLPAKVLCHIVLCYSCLMTFWFSWHYNNTETCSLFCSSWFVMSPSFLEGVYICSETLLCEVSIDSFNVTHILYRTLCIYLRHWLTGEIIHPHITDACTTPLVALYVSTCLLVEKEK